MYMCLVMTTWDWVNYRGICPWIKRIFLLSVIMGETLFCPFRVVWVLLTQPYCWDFMDAATLSCLKRSLTGLIVGFSLAVIYLLFYNVSEPKVEGLCCCCAVWDWAPCGQPFSVFWLVLNLSSNLYLLRKKACLVSGESYICPRGKV